MKTTNVIEAYRHFEALAKIATPAMVKEIPYGPARGERLYTKLLKIERKMRNIAIWQCNGYVVSDRHPLTDKDNDRLEKQWEKGCEQVKALIAEQFHKYLKFNGDPRGYTLKMNINRIEKKENDIQQELSGMHQDFGGYYILAPDF